MRNPTDCRRCQFRPSSASARRRHVPCAFLRNLLQGRTGPPKRQAFQTTDKVSVGTLEVSPMGIGTWAWGNKLLWGYEESMDPELQQLFNYVVDRGVNLFDTADSYGTGFLNGRSEELLGRFAREYPGRTAKGDIHIATKLAGYPWRVTPWNMVQACRGSMRRLQADAISIGQLHWSAAKYAPLQEWAMVNGIADCYLQGLVRNVGVSNYGPKQLRKVHAQLAKRGVPLASAQVQFSLLSWGSSQQELVETCKELGVALIAYSPLGLGLLTGKYGDGIWPPGVRGRLLQSLQPEVAPVLSTLKEVAEVRDKSESQVALNWCMCKGAIPIPGVKSLSMAQDNLGACGWRLTEAEELALDTAVLSIQRGMVQNIFQTA